MSDHTTMPPQAGGPPSTPPPSAPPPPAAPPTNPAGGPPGPSAPRRSRWTAGRIISLVIGAVSGVAALAVFVGGLALLVADQTMRDSDGYLTSPNLTVSSSGYAVATGDIVLEGTPGQSDLWPSRLIGDLRVRVTPQRADAPLFVGIAPTGGAQAYLSGVARTQTDSPGSSSRDIPGGPPPVPPASAEIWVAGASGSGAQEFTWSPRTGQWTLVVMNPDGSAGVDATVQVGAEVPWLTGLAIVILVLGIIGLAVAIVLVVVPVSLVSRDLKAARAATTPPAPGSPAAGTSPGGPVPPGGPPPSG